MQHVIHVDGHPFSSDVEHFGFPWTHNIQHMEELQKLAQFPNLKSANFCSTNLDDLGLASLCQAATLERLDLQNTKITNNGLAHLANLPHLQYLRLKENRQLTNESVPHLRRLKSLAELQIHETSIDQTGLEQLAEMTNLRNLLIHDWNNDYTFGRLLALLVRMPNCTILAKGRGEFIGGQFHGTWPMTEQEWLASDEPQQMLNFIRDRASGRKVRLCAVACCRRVWDSMKHNEFRNAVDAAEKYGDGLLDQEAMTQARQSAITVFVDLHAHDNGSAAALSAAGVPSPPCSSTGEWWEDEFDTGDVLAPALVTFRHAARAASDLNGESLLTERPTMLAEYRNQASLLRCIFGNPFRPVDVDPSWLTPTVVALARQIDESREFSTMPVLADAVQDAGCAETELLNHCRGPGPHARGCWVLDLLLGKQ